MNEFPWSEWSAPGVAMLFALLVITGRLVWHRTVAKLEKDRDYWRKTALDLLGVNEQVVKHNEVTARALAALPLPERQEHDR